MIIESKPFLSLSLSKYHTVHVVKIFKNKKDLITGATRLWPGKVRILRRAHGWVRDGFVTTDQFSVNDFMIHGWKNQRIGDNGWQSPFEVSHLSLKF